MPKWVVEVRYSDNPAGPLRGKEIIQQDAPPQVGDTGLGVWGRFIVKSRRPRRVLDTATYDRSTWGIR